ncbi:MAG: VCBS repeat-containing protein [Firmicutes bacterium]|nr:VCBS repeat-containing protein [Bacillota bacterium]
MKYIPRWTVLIALLTLVAALPLTVQAASNDYLLRLETGRTVPLTDSNWQLIGVGDVSGDSRTELAFVHGDTISFYHINRLNQYVLWQEYSFDAPISTAKLGDLDGDGTLEVIVGYDDIGIIDVIGWADSKWWKSYSRVYLWSQVSNLDILHLSGFPFNLILAITEDGTINLLRWNGIHPELHYENTSQKGKSLEYAGSGDFNGDGDSDFALIVDGAEVQVYSPGTAELKPVWTNYPWGGVSGSDVWDIDEDGLAEVVTASPVGLLYAFEWKGSYYAQKWRYQDIPGIPQGLEVIRLPKSGRLALISGIRGDVVVWPLNENGIPLYRVEIPHPYGDWVLSDQYTATGILGRTGEGKTLTIQEYPDEEVSIYYHLEGREFQELTAVIHYGRLWLPLRELAPLYDLKVDWNQISDLLYLSKERLFMIFDAAESTIWVNGLPYKTTDIKKFDGIYCIGLPLAEQIFGFKTHWLNQKAYLFTKH